MASVNPGDEVIRPAPADVLRRHGADCGRGVPECWCLLQLRPMASASRLSSWRRPSPRALAIHQLAFQPQCVARPCSAEHRAARCWKWWSATRRVWLLADDIHEHILYDGRVCHARRRAALFARAHADGERCLQGRMP